MGYAMRSIPPSIDSPPVLSLEALEVSFSVPDGEVRAVRDFALAIQPGECVGVVGESGAGKSQAFLGAFGLLAANGCARGRARFRDIDLLGAGVQALDRIRGARVGFVFQDPMTSLTPHLRIGDQIAEPAVRHLGLSWGEARARALSLLRRVQVTDPEQRMRQYPHELSGGMRQRVMIAIALACDPELLIADEPTTALDVTIQAQILSLLAELKRERAMALVLITHDLGVVAGLADRVAVVQGGRIVELDTVRAVLKTPRHEYTRSLLQTAAGAGGWDAQASVAAEPVLQVSHLNMQFVLRRRGWFGSGAVLHAVQDVSLELRSGEALGVVGESGSGKSTLARAALHLLPPTSGRVVWLGAPVNELDAREIKAHRRDLQIIFQDPLASLDPRMRVGEIVAEPLRVHEPALQPTQRALAVTQMLQRVGLPPQMAERYPHELSGGQCQRVGIARAMILKPRVLICDEPVSALDVATQEQVLRLLSQLKREYGVGMLFVSHNLAVVQRLCERVLVLYLGRMMELAPAAALFAQPVHPYTAGLLAAIPLADPDIQPARLAQAAVGEPPSPLRPPSGCVFRTRCIHADARCAERVPEWQDVSGGRYVACHRWREL
jgi:oligopeptide/dipeptide ABC transporter ATP-binding protein